MRIFLGPGGVPLTAPDRDTVSGIRQVSNLGLSAMEVEFVHGVRMGAGAADEAGKAARELGVRLSVHAPYFINLCNPEKAGDSEKRILDSCEKAHLMGAGVVVFHPGFYGKLEKKDALGMVEKSCAGMASVIRERGWGVRLGLETTGKYSQFGTVEEILEICRKNRSCTPVVDWAHLFALHQGKPDFRGIMDSVTGAGHLKLHTHFSGINFTDKGERNHMAISHKRPDFSVVARLILGSALEEITLISESPELEKDSLVMKKELERLGHVF